jgi:hypothetical protein
LGSPDAIFCSLWAGKIWPVLLLVARLDAAMDTWQSSEDKADYYAARRITKGRKRARDL